VLGLGGGGSDRVDTGPGNVRVSRREKEHVEGCKDSVTVTVVAATVAVLTTGLMVSMITVAGGGWTVRRTVVVFVPPYELFPLRTD